MTDTDRLQRVARELAEAIEARARGQKVSLPVIQPADAAGLMHVMYTQLDDAIARRDAQIGARMACHEGCNACCASPVLATEGEAVAIAEWLRQPENVERLARFEVAYASWSEQLGTLVEQNERDAAANQSWVHDIQRRRVMCAFNADGACTVYPVRPGLCRKTHALDTNANCSSEDVPAKCYQHPETEQLFDDQRALRFALHKALRPGHRLELLCASVARLLRRRL